MYDFDGLVAEVLRNRPELSRDSLMKQIQEKKQTVGSGYLTDQGALFLVAGELGVKLHHMISSDLTLKDLHIGANDITVVARVLAVYPVAEFKKKDGSGVGHYRRVNLFDVNGIAKLTIWEDNEEALKFSGIGVDAPVRILSAYVKQGLDGKPALNLGKRGKIEVITDEAVVSKLMPLSALVKQVGDVKDGEIVLVLEGVAATETRRSTFTRRDDGSQGSLTQFELKGPGERTMRVVVWDAVELLDVKVGSKIRVTNLKHKKGRQEGEAELHGDSATVIQVVGEGVKGKDQVGGQGLRLVKVAEVEKYASSSVDLEVMALSKGSVRDVNMRDGSISKKGEVVLGDDTGEITAVAWDETSKMIGEIKVGEKLRVRGASVQVSKMGAETLELGRSTKLERLQ